MRDIFEDIYANEPAEPTEAARRNMRVPLRKRFFERASVNERGAVLLDGKPVKTPARNALAAPSIKLAQAIADEWDAQREVIDPARMPLTRLANVVVDAIHAAPQAVVREIEQYLGTDLILYRAESPQELIDKQAQAWDPILVFMREKFGARFVLGQGIVHVAQPPEAVKAAARAIPFNAWQVGALGSMTTLTGSALIALAHAHGALTVDEAWAAAHVDEDFQMSQWGRDAEAMKRREARYAEMQAAATVLRHLS